MITWMRRNLFRSITDTILTVISASIVGYVIFQVFQFVFVTGRWEIIQVNLKILLVGRFPEELMFLVGFSILATCFSIASLASGMNRPLDQPPTLAGKLWELFQRFGLIIATSAFLIVLAGDLDAVLFGAYVVLSIFAGRLFGTARRTTLLRRLPGWLWLSINATLPLVLIFLTMGQAALEEWGGFLINFYLAVVSIALSFPLGVMLALGRRSTLPLLRWLSTAYIELIRGAPLFVRFV